MRSSIKKKLLPYQIDHTKNLADKLIKNHICFDSTFTGFGKTYSAIATAKVLKMKVFVICPKTIIASWKKVIEIFDVECLTVINYEMLILGKHYDKKNKSEKCKYITKTSNKFIYEWNLPENTLIIFDEVHRCCNIQSLTGNLLISLKDIYDEKHPILMLSATICDGPAKFKLFGLLLKWYPNYNYTGINWLEPTYNPVRASELIRQKLNPNNMCRVNIDDLGTAFKKNQVNADYYDIGKTDANKIDELHRDIMKNLKDLQNKSLEDRANGWALCTRNFQKIELLKVQVFVDLVEQYLANNFSIVIFVSFTATLELLAQTLKTKCIVYGGQDIKTRLKNIDDFIADKERIIILNIKCGGESISLNDKHGKYQRVALISPPQSSIKLIQACGRISRADSKTISINKIIYANTTYEKQLYNKIKDKCSMYNTITDQDMTYNFDE